MKKKYIKTSGSAYTKASRYEVTTPKKTHTAYGHSNQHESDDDWEDEDWEDEDWEDEDWEE